ncbi:sensor domain-containing diguanylate cyclase [Nocardia sp. BMG111209]|uniref:sensor domain-containing diguanylate cyclase n=1 Tax=Nocardia sp. BMG111209 TaxID=1160137 RepID=UPI0003687AAA|nr:sensor domain-containing diguanylate cyclase [Nocardia sp. BMG111209]
MTHNREFADLARQWRIAVADTGFVPMPMRELDRLLTGFLTRLAAAAVAEPVGVIDAADVGAELVRANLTDPQVLSRSFTALAPLAEIVAPHTDRLLDVLGALSRGYTEELLATRGRHLEMLHTATAEARNAAEIRFRVVFDNTTVAIGICDAEGRVVDANPALRAMLGLPLARLRGRPVADLVHPDDRGELHSRIAGELMAAGEGTLRLELRYAHDDGGEGWAAWAVTLVPESAARAAYLLIVGEDTTQRRALQTELHRQARHDPLTGLPNRRQLIDTMAELIDAAAPGDRIGLGFLDLDGFKAVNDTHGHGTGDRLLTAVATRLARHAEPELLARVGGDEFVVLFPPPCDIHRVSVVAERLLEAVAEPIPVDGLLLSISACLGAVVTAVSGTDAEHLLDAADTGLYRAKAAGPNRWVLHTPRADVRPVAVAENTVLD